jgi:hypothetical protein
VCTAPLDGEASDSSSPIADTGAAVDVSVGDEATLDANGATTDVTASDGGPDSVGEDAGDEGDAVVGGDGEAGPTAMGSCGAPARVCPAGGCTPELVLFGGVGESGLLSDTWVWDGGQWAELSVDAGPSPRSGAGVVTDCDGVFLYGGAIASPPYYSDEEWVWINDTWFQLPSPEPDAGPRPRSDFAIAKLGSQMTVLFGGAGEVAGALQDTWIWDDTSWSCWSCQPLVHSPPSLHDTAFGAVGGSFVIFGGYSDLGLQKLQGTTWLWGGVDWGAPNLLSGSPSPRSNVASASLVVNGTETLVVFGGFDGTTTLDETWVWDGLSWTQMHPATEVPARTSASAATLGDRVVLFGGYGVDGALLDNATYTWDGTDWYEQPTTSPSPPKRGSASMAAMPP